MKSRRNFADNHKEALKSRRNFADNHKEATEIREAVC
jgi:hypothetical protein